MTEEEKRNYLKAMTRTDDTDDVLNVFLNISGEKIIHKAFPYDDSVVDVPLKYHTLQCEIAAYLLNKRGAEGQVTHSENGIQRQYENADVPVSMLQTIVPFCGVIKSEDDGN